MLSLAPPSAALGVGCLVSWGQAGLGRGLPARAVCPGDSGGVTWVGHAAQGLLRVLLLVAARSEQSRCDGGRGGGVGRLLLQLRGLRLGESNPWARGLGLLLGVLLLLLLLWATGTVEPAWALRVCQTAVCLRPAAKPDQQRRKGEREKGKKLLSNVHTGPCDSEQLNGTRTWDSLVHFLKHVKGWPMPPGGRMW